MRRLAWLVVSLAVVGGSRPVASQPPCVDGICKWGPWTTWSAFTKSCGGQLVRASRLQDRCGALCDGFRLDRELCRPVCYNGGTLEGERCSCPKLVRGPCCNIGEHHSINQLQARSKDNPHNNEVKYVVSIFSLSR